MDNETLISSPVFLGLTKPPMIAGITLDYMSICFLISLGLFIVTDDAFFACIYLPLHVFGWIACKIDHNIFSIFIKRAECAYSPNKKIWGCQSYAPF